MGRAIRKTRSLCPVCLKNLKAELIEDGGVISISRVCPEHGGFSAPVWQGLVDFNSWTASVEPLPEGSALACPGNCGICPEHEAGSCCVLIEVTKRCNLRCRFCFADGGSSLQDESTDEVKRQIKDIYAKRGKVLLQLSGGEPTLRDDLPELIACAKGIGIPYVQVNTNGLRLSEDKDYVKALAEAGLDIVFLQFDGTDDEIYKILRARPLLGEKLAAIQNCGESGIGVTLVPTVVPGVNDKALGDIVRYAASMVPIVRGVHFQPVSYFGRCPDEEPRRYTLDRLMYDLSEQAGFPLEVFRPSRCDHPLCGFHTSFLIRPDGSLRPVATGSDKSRGCAGDNREYVARHWRRNAPEPEPALSLSDEMDFDTFLYCLRQRSLALSAMAFQDAGNINLERLHCCTLHVYDKGAVRPFCANYLTKF